MIHNLLPSSPGALLSHSHCSAGPLLLNSCSHLILDYLPPLLSPSLVITGGCDGSWPSPSSGYSPTRTPWCDSACSTAASALHVLPEVESGGWLLIMPSLYSFLSNNEICRLHMINTKVIKYFLQNAATTVILHRAATRQLHSQVISFRNCFFSLIKKLNYSTVHDKYTAVNVCTPLEFLHNLLGYKIILKLYVFVWDVYNVFYCTKVIKHF